MMSMMIMTRMITIMVGTDLETSGLASLLEMDFSSDGSCW